MSLWQHFRRMLRGPAFPPRSRCRGNRQPRHGGDGSNHRRRPPHSLGRAALRGLRRLFTSPSRSRLIRGRTVAYHGTPSVQNARSIIRDGFAVGCGNALGDGIYLATDLATAKAHAGSSGVYLKCLVKLGRTGFWGASMQARYAVWCQSRGVRQDNSAKTAFALQHGFNTLQNGNVVVVLAPQFANPTAWKRKLNRIKIVSIHRAADDRRLNV